MNPIKIYAEIQAERDRQEQLREEGKFDYTCADPLDDHWRHVILAEEVGEVAEAILSEDRANLREELLQVAAVAIAWIEGLDWASQGHVCQVGPTAAYCEVCPWAFQTSDRAKLEAAADMHRNGIGRKYRRVES